MQYFTPKVLPDVSCQFITIAGLTFTPFCYNPLKIHSLSFQFDKIDIEDIQQVG